MRNLSRPPCHRNPNCNLPSNNHLAESPARCGQHLAAGKPPLETVVALQAPALAIAPFPPAIQCAQGAHGLQLGWTSSSCCLEAVKRQESDVQNVVFKYRGTRAFPGGGVAYALTPPNLTQEAFMALRCQMFCLRMGASKENWRTPLTRNHLSRLPCHLSLIATLQPTKQR